MVNSETEELRRKLMLLSQDSVMQGRTSSDQEWAVPY